MCVFGGVGRGVVMLKNTGKWERDLCDCIKVPWFKINF